MTPRAGISTGRVYWDTLAGAPLLTCDVPASVWFGELGRFSEAVMCDGTKGVGSLWVDADPVVGGPLSNLDSDALPHGSGRQEL